MWQGGGFTTALVSKLKEGKFRFYREKNVKACASVFCSLAQTRHFYFTQNAKNEIKPEYKNGTE